MEIIGKKDVAKWKEFGISTFKAEVINQNETVVCEAESSFQFRRKTIIEN